MATCCFCRRISDVEQRPFHAGDIDQQIEIVYTSTTKKFDLGEALHLNATHRQSRQLGDLLSLADTASAVGKWYSMFFLVIEASVARREKMECSASYEVMLEQRWEMVNENGVGSKLASKRALVGGVMEAKQESLMNSQQGDAHYNSGSRRGR
nr:unnamed protein product [Digitaria exilis]